jgi:hypothetical protein
LSGGYQAHRISQPDSIQLCSTNIGSVAPALKEQLSLQDFEVILLRACVLNKKIHDNVEVQFLSLFRDYKQPYLPLHTWTREEWW